MEAIRSDKNSYKAVR